ncbi:hypothetical protein MPTK1_5g18440 [Marchantia polymorpha subsp. ruderalis]
MARNDQVGRDANVYGWTVPLLHGSCKKFIRDFDFSSSTKFADSYNGDFLQNFQGCKIVQRIRTLLALIIMWVIFSLGPPSYI